MPFELHLEFIFQSSHRPPLLGKPLRIVANPCCIVTNITAKSGAPGIALGIAFQVVIAHHTYLKQSATLSWMGTCNRKQCKAIIIVGTHE